ncbi:sensor histidine kinase [Metabacillus halosaccharovorans]|uniref:sensor histidine kinase n=1 Tax=Metabacillus halosaccharovorans TaxID=930124 RepID=UPI001C1F8377|nr:histidine kinase [Metabacillus halosaccharovorans]MBU7591277.1 hypothetical protein [Metabacillus halosaccharovorans]
MLRNKQLHIKVFVVYTFILITLILLVAIPINWYLKESLKQSLDRDAKSTAENISTQLDVFFNEYNQITQYFYLNQDHEGFTPIEYLEILNGSPSNDVYMQTQNALINNLAFNSEVYENIIRISLLAEDLLFLSSKNSSKPFEKQNYIEGARKKAGDVYVEFHNSDPWNINEGDPVLIFTRQLRISNREIGFLEVQYNGLPLSNVSLMKDSTITILNEDGRDILYQEKKVNEEQMTFFRELINSDNTKVSKTFNEQVHYYIRSNHSNFHLFYSVDEKQIYSPVSHFNSLMIIGVLFVIFLTAGAFFITAKKLTFPLRNLKNVIDTVDLEEKPSKIENQNHLNEIEALNLSFQLMNKRLQNSLDKIVKFHTSQLQLKFKLLQAQINPHFIFNMLGVVTILAKRGKNLEVERISRQLADFLRYTTSSEKNQTQLSKEVRFTETYLDLMKTRYKDRLTYTIDIPSSLMEIEIPKLMIQPLVENCLSHGFTNNRVLNLSIEGVKSEETWKVIVRDNGPGFNDETLEKIHRQMKEYNINSDKYSDLSIGGMGILSTYIRLNLFYSNKMIFELDNMISGGAVVVIGGSIDSTILLNNE